MRRTKSYKGNKGFWNKEIKNYYITKRGLKQKISDTEKDHKISIASCKNGDLAFTWGDLTADFGEVCTSWFLEEKDKILFVRVRWIESPLTIGKGVDLMGVQPSSHSVCYAESKTRNSRYTSQIKKPVDELSSQLSDTRLAKRFNSPQSIYQSLIWLKDILEELIKKGDFLLNEKDIDIILKNKKYLRHGSIIRPENGESIDFSNAFQYLDDECRKFRGCENTCVENCEDRSPITFIDFQLEDLEIEINAFLQTIS